MKKYLALVIAIVMLFSFAACQGEVSMEETKTASSDEKSPIKTDEKLLTVDVTLDGSLFEGETPEQIKAEAKENGILKCVVNEDGSVTYTMTKAKRDELLEEMKKGFEETYEDFLSGDNKVESFVDIKSNDDFSKVDVYVDGSKYTAWDSMNAMAFYYTGAYYQCFSGVAFEDVDVTVNFIDNETKEVLDTASYKDFVANAS